MRKLLFFIIVLLAVVPAFGQYGLGNPNRQMQTLGVQTTARGIIHYAAGPPNTKITWRATKDTAAYYWVDTLTARQYSYNHTADKWLAVGVFEAAALPPSTFTNGAATIDNRTAFWYNTTSNGLYFYDRNLAGWGLVSTGSGDNWGTQVVQTNATLTGNGTAGTPLGIAQQSATTGQVLKWNGTTWAPAADNAGGGGGTWGSITGTLSAQTDLQSALDGKAATSHTHAPANITQAGATTGQVLKWNGTAWAPAADDTGGGGGTWGSITGTLSAQTDLQSALDGKAATAHTHVIADVTGLQSALDGKAATSHTHAPADITQAGATTGQVLKWNGSAWAPAADTDTDTDLQQIDTFSLSSTTLSLSIQRDARPASTVSFSGWDTNASNDITTATAGAGDVTGTFPTLTVDKVDNVQVSAAGAADGQVLKWSVSNNRWEPSNDVGGGAGDNWGTQVVQTNATLTGNGTAGTPLGIAQQSATTGQVLKWNGTTWAPANDTDTNTGVWGSITGTLSAQTDLQSALNGKAATSHTHAPGDITQAGATTGQVLKWNGSTWAPANDTDTNTGVWGSITGTLSAQTDLQSALNGKAATSHTHAPADITQAGATTGQVLKWNGSAWAPAADTDIDTDAQTLSFVNPNLSISGGNSVDLSALTANQTVTLSGAVTGSGATAITTAISAGAVGASELASTAVTPGSYTYTSLTVDADGRITAAANGTTPALTSGTLAQFSATTSAQLAGVISDETGTGAVVLATSPTLTTPNLGTPSAVTLTNGTGLPQAGVVNLTTDLAGKQPLDADLTALAGLTSAADALPYFTGVGTASTTTLTTFGRSIIDDANAAAARTTLGVDPAGTDNSTPVTLAGTPDYITIAGQVITRNAVDLATDITGALPLANIAQSGAVSGQVLEWNGTAWAPATDDTGGGGVSDGDKGDIVVSGGGTVWTIEAGAVADDELASTAVTPGSYTYTSLTVDADGRITAAANGTTPALTSGTLAQFAATTSAQLAGVVSDETGTGAVVLATSPTLTTPNLGTPSAVTLTNGTGLPLSTGVTGTLGSTNGGTGNAFFAVSGPATSTKTFTFPNASSTVLTTNTAVTVAQGGTGRTTSTTAYGLIAAGTTATGALQTLPTGGTNQILVGGGASALPSWTTATGSGAPVLATSPALTTPDLGTPSAVTLTNGTGLPQSGVVNLTTDLAGKQPLDADLTALAGLTSAADALPYFTGIGTASTTTLTTFGRSIIDDANAAAARTTLGVDPAGTDNSTPVTLAGTPDYITISGQVITRNAVDLATDITGALPLANIAQSGATTGQVLEWNGTAWAPATDDTGGGGDHGTLTGLADDDHTQYALLAGRTGGQILTGGTAASNALTLRSTTDATKGDVVLNDQGGNVVVGGAATASEIRFMEPSGGGSNYTAIKAQTQAGNVTYTLPAADGSSGQVLSTNGTGTLSWATAGGGAPSVITPAEITVTQDNYAPTGWADATVVRLSGNSGFHKITGFSAETSGEVKTLVNVGSNCVYLAPEHTGSTAGNRISYHEEVIIPPGQSCQIYYDGTLSRWGILTTPSPTYRVGRKAVYFDDALARASTAASADNALDIWGSITVTEGDASATEPFNYLNLNSGATASGGAGVMYPHDHAGAWVTSAHIVAKTHIRTPNAVGDATNNYYYFLRIADSPYSGFWDQNNTVGIYYRYSDNAGKWFLRSRSSGGVNTEVDSGITFAADTEYELQVSLNKAANEATFWINGAVVGRITTNLPSATNVGWSQQLEKTAGTTARSVKVYRFIGAAIAP